MCFCALTVQNALFEYGWVLSVADSVKNRSFHFEKYVLTVQCESFNVMPWWSSTLILHPMCLSLQFMCSGSLWTAAIHQYRLLQVNQSFMKVSSVSLEQQFQHFPCLVLHWHARQFANGNFISSCSALQRTSFFLVSLLHGSFNCHETLPGQLHNWLHQGWFFNTHTQPQSSWTLGFVTLRHMRVISSVTAWTSNLWSPVTWPLSHTAPTNLATATAV